MGHGYGYGYGYDDERRLGSRLAIGAAVAVVVGTGYLGLTHLGAAAGQGATSNVGVTSSDDTSSTTTTTTSTSTSTTTTTTTAPPSSTSTVTASSSTPSTPARASTSSTSTSSSTSNPPQAAPGNTLPDGSPVPVAAIFDVDTITLAGVVPSRSAADRLTMLAQANSTTPAAVIDLLSIDPSVPIGVGVRVVELNSPRFAAGTSTITLAHGAQLQRMVDVMGALPNVTVLVVGHADQIGSDVANMELSEQRAQAVVEFMIDQGVAPERLAARAVGETDLLSLADDAAALALNRRTEFVVYGALIE